MPEKPLPVPARYAIREFQTPNPVDGFYTELISRDDPTYQGVVTPVRGTLYSSMKSADSSVVAKFPHLYFLKEVRAYQSHTLVFWIWATDPQAENSYNSEDTYTDEDLAYPEFNRVYTVRRDVYNSNNTPLSLQSTLTAVTAIFVTNGGSGYSSATTISFSGGSGTGAVAIPIIAAGVIITIIVTVEGSGYTSAPTVAINDATGSGAAATAVIQPQGAKLVSQKKREFPDESPLRNEYVQVVRKYQTLPGPIRLGQDIDKISGIVTNYSAQIVAAGTVSAEIIGGSISSLVLHDGGSGFTAGTYNLAFSGGGGSGAAGTYTVATFTAGALANPVVTSGGNGYTTAPTINIAGGGGGASAHAVLTGTTVASVSLLTTQSTFQVTPDVIITDSGTGTGAAATAIFTPTSIDSIPVSVAGSGNSTGTITISPPDVAGSTQATADPVFSGGALTSVTITNAGTGYTKTPTVSLVADGTGALLGQPLLTATSVASFQVTASGALYQNPSVTVVDPVTSATATAQVNLSPTSVQSVVIDNAGSGYTAPTLTFVGGGGSGATATVGLLTGKITSLTLTNAGSGYTNNPTITTPSGGGSGAIIQAGVGSLTYVDRKPMDAARDLILKSSVDRLTFPEDKTYPVSVRVRRTDKTYTSLIVLQVVNTSGGSSGTETAVGLNRTSTIGGSGPVLGYMTEKYMTDLEYASFDPGTFSISGVSKIFTMAYSVVDGFPGSGQPKIWTFEPGVVSQGTSAGVYDLTSEEQRLGVRKVMILKIPVNY